MSTALGFFDGYLSERLSANLLQAQRDYLGAHTYELLGKKSNLCTPTGPARAAPFPLLLIWPNVDECQDGETFFKYVFMTAIVVPQWCCCSSLASSSSVHTASASDRRRCTRPSKPEPLTPGTSTTSGSPRRRSRKYKTPSRAQSVPQAKPSAAKRAVGDD
ncbi:hypothetical protein quinque_002426 [Culex quinquefasciatus]